MDFYTDGPTSPSSHVKPTRSNMTKLGFQSAEKKFELETVKEDAF